jgi:hypothetical protein
VPLAIHHQRWVLAAFLAGLSGAAINGAKWLSHQLPGECLDREVGLTGRIVTLPREQRLVTGQQRITAEMDVMQVDDTFCAGPKRVRLIQYLEGTEVDTPLWYHARVNGRWRFEPLASQMNPGSHPDQARWASRGIDAAVTPVAQLTLALKHHLIARFRSLVLDAWADRKGEGWAAMRALLGVTLSRILDH